MTALEQINRLYVMYDTKDSRRLLQQLLVARMPAMRNRELRTQELFAAEVRRIRAAGETYLNGKII